MAFFILIKILIEHSVSKQWRTASDLDLHCLPMSHEKDAKLIWVYCMSIYVPRHEISNNVVYATSKGSYQPAHTRSLIRAFASCLNIV